ncbi:hypothetical protein JOM56_002288, partial [Amanita muscaria]
HWAIPRKIWKSMQASKAGLGQKTLDSHVQKPNVPKGFTKENLLLSVTKFVACDNQSLAIADNAAFRNCLVAMCPKTLKSELPSAYDVSVCLHNEAVKWIKKLKAEIEVSV